MNSKSYLRVIKNLTTENHTRKFISSLSQEQWSIISLVNFETPLHWICAYIEHKLETLTILTGKSFCSTYKNSFKYKVGCFWRFQYVYTINCKCLKNVIHQIDSKAEWLLLSVTFAAKFELIFVLTFENAFS